MGRIPNKIGGKIECPAAKKKLARKNIRYNNNQNLRHYKFFAENIICSKNNTIKNTRHNYVLKQIHFLFTCKPFIILNIYKIARQIKLKIKNRKFYYFKLKIKCLHCCYLYFLFQISKVV